MSSSARPDLRRSGAPTHVDGSPYRLLLVDDEPSNLELLTRTLRDEGSVIAASAGEEALSVIDREEIDLLITDQRMPEITGITVATHLKQKNPLAVRIMLTGHTDADDLMGAINEGEVYRYLTKPWDPQDLQVTVRRALEAYGLRCERARIIDDLEQKNLAIADRTRQLAELNISLERQIDERTAALAEVNRRLVAAAAELSLIAQTDPLTGLWNARTIRQELARELTRARRFSRSLGVLCIHVEGLQQVADEQGSVVGARALRVVAGVLLGALKHIDSVARFGEGEFIAVVPHLDQAAAEALTAEVAAAISSVVVPQALGGRIPLRIHTGVAAFPSGATEAEELLGQARRAAGRT